MGVYGNIINNIEEQQDTFVIVSEGVTNIKLFEDISKWKTQNEKHFANKFVSNSVSDKDFEKLKECLNIMKTTESFDEYKKALSRFCYFCNISPRGLVLRRYSLEKGKSENKNSVYILQRYPLDLNFHF